MGALGIMSKQLNEWRGDRAGILREVQMNDIK